MKGRKTIVRLISACLTLVVILLYAKTSKDATITRGTANAAATRRHLMAATSTEEYEYVNDELMSVDYQEDERKALDTFIGAESNSCNNYGSDVDNANCSKPLHHGNESCQFVQDYCSDDVALINYLSFVTCDLPSVKPLAFIILGVWLLYLISLLATTADYFFVPPLNLLAEKLRLSPSIAGITLLAVGNGAPDVFTAYSALNNGDMPLVLGALIGASIFISTVVLGTVILVTNVSSKTIDKIDFVRDVVAYMIVVGTVIGVAFDGYIHIYEAVLFPILYILYIAVAVALSYFRVWWKKRQGVVSPTMTVNNGNTVNESREETESVDGVESAAEQTPLIEKELPQLITVEPKRLELPGLTWPRGQNIFIKIQWALEFPFSLLRWISVPPCCHDGNWSQWHRWFAVSSPVPMVAVLLVAAKGWAGFTETIGDKFPMCVIPFIIAILMSIGFFFIIKATPPHWIVQSMLGILAFIMSIAWLNIEANEVVSVLEAFGLAFSIDTAVLGLTVLAIGNSVGDWVADTAVARAGEPGMGVASCFGSPLLNDVLGLSVALIARIAIKDHGKTFKICIHDPEYVKVKLSWIFLAISLVMSAVVFPLCKFSPPRWYGIVLIYIYVVFMVFSVLDEVNVLRFNL